MNVLILEVQNIHVECIHSEIHFLHLKGERVFLACNEEMLPSIIEKNKLTGMLSFRYYRSTWRSIGLLFKIRKFIRRNKIDTVILNSPEAHTLRNLVLFFPRVHFVGLAHVARMLESSGTFKYILRLRVKKFLVLGDSLLKMISPARGFQVASFYPIYFPKVNLLFVKPPGEIWIAIPGRATEQYKDFSDLFDLIIEKGGLTTRIKFILLGVIEMPGTTREKLQSYPCKDHFILFDKYIDYDQFHSYILQSDFVLPLLLPDGSWYFKEKKITGAFNLALGYKLPMLLPEIYKNYTDLIDYSIFYNNIREIVEKLLIKGSLDQPVEKIRQAYETGRFASMDAEAESFVNFVRS